MEPEFRGTKTLQPFAPRWTDPELLEKTLVGRRQLVDKLEQLAIEGAGGPNKFQRLIIGPRGSGKTHVLKVLHTRLWRNDAVRDRLLIVYLLEDELGVASYLDFLVRLLKAIAQWYPDPAFAAKLDGLYNLPATAQERRATELLLEAAGAKDVLLIMENLGVTFDAKQGFGRRGQQSLRDLVQRNPRFMIFASAQALLDGISQPNAPFYEFFHITRLKKLSLEEAAELLAAVATAYGNEEALRFLATAEGRGRVRAIYDFTGGNHRLLVTFYDILAAESLTQISDAFIEALKPLKPYYQEQMRALSAQQQKIIQYLSLDRTPRTVKDIARGCLATSNTVSSQMKQLLDKGFVERIEQGRESYYEIAETLFRICYEADLDQGAPIRLFVDFLGNFYTAQELEARAQGFRLLAHETEASFYRSALEAYHHRAVEEGPAEWGSFFRNLAAQHAYGEIISFARRLGETKDAAVVLVEAEAYEATGNVAHACEVLRRQAERSPDDANVHARLGAVLLKAKDYAGAEGCCRKALELVPDHRDARRALAAALIELDRFEEALAELEAIPEAARAGVDWSALAELYEKRGKVEDAKAGWAKVVEAEPTDVTARIRLGSLYLPDAMETALNHFEAAIAVKPSDAAANIAAGAVLIGFGRFAAAEGYLRIATGTGLGDLARSALAFVLGRLDRHGEASQIAEQVLSSGKKLSPEFTSMLGDTFRAAKDLSRAEECYRTAAQEQPTASTTASLAAVLQDMKRYDEAEAVLRTAVAQWPSDATLRIKWVKLLGDRGRYAEALAASEELEQLAPEDVRGFLYAGALASILGENASAEEHFRRAIGLAPEFGPARIFLGDLLARVGKVTEAATVFEQAQSVALVNGELWFHIGRGLARVSRPDQAESALRRALELRHHEAAIELARLLRQSGRAREAESLLTELLGNEPENTKAKNALADLFLLEGRYREAYTEFIALQSFEPGNASLSFGAGVAAFSIDRVDEAERQFRRAIETDSALTPAWISLALTLAGSGRQAEALRTLDEAPKSPRVFIARGNIRSKAGEYPAAAAEYRAALALEPENTEALYRLAAALLPQGEVREAADAFVRALRGGGADASANSALENLFTYCTRTQMAPFLDPVLDAYQESGRMESFEQSLSVVIFDLLKKHETLPEERYTDTAWALEEIVGKRMNVSIPLLFVNVGIDYFKKGDRKALMRLSREERALFTEQLGIGAEA